MKWNNFLKELGNLIFFWLFGIVFFSAFRTLFIAIFHKQLAPGINPTELMKVFQMGFRFDCTATAYFLLPPFLALLTLSYANQFGAIRKVRIFSQYAFLVLSTVICMVTLNFFSEYNEQFNNFTFLGLYDDRSAIFSTIMEYYHPWLNLLAVAGTVAAGALILRRFEERTFIASRLARIRFRGHRAVIVLLALLLFTSNIRGTVWGNTPNRRWASVSKDAFLNKTVINPYRSLKYAYKDFRQLGFDKNNPFGEEDLQALYNAPTVLQAIGKQAQGAPIERPKQVFLIIMESYDSWPLMEKYKPFGISQCLAEIAGKGTHFANFLPAYNATMYAYNTITTGIPYCGVQLNYMGSVNDPYATSIFNQFKAMGYATNFFYGGFLSWQHIGDFTEYQGCDRIYSGVDIEGSDMGYWGIEDEKLFDLILDKVDPDEYTLNVVLTASYHPPYEIDVHAKGFPYHTPDDLPAEMRKYYDKGMTLQEIGHLWYSDREIGRFMQRAEQQYEGALYSFTGDHYGRRFLTHTPTLYEKSSVPFILYHPQLAPAKPSTPGDHADIIPTLIELVAPEGFTYYSFGTSMLDPDKPCGMGFEKAIDRDSLYYFPKAAPVEAFSLATEKTQTSHQNKYEEAYLKRLMLSWHYVMRGNNLLPEEE